ncbi:MAG: HEAT repeat domain-containing protein [Sedimentisphaerales bacterium]|nr:HEAT repeat domain-containing protein [Sedimentisphaerales bacterium]
MSRRLKVSAIIAVVVCCCFFSNWANAAEDANAFGQLLDKIRTYDYGKSRADLTRISDMIRQSSGKPEIKEIEKQLDEFLKSDATYAAKQFVCQELSVIGTEASVAALAPMLTNDKYSDMARYALERIPGEAAGEALREALGAVSGSAKIGIINSIGVRGDKKAVGLLSGVISDFNQMASISAVAALGRIDDPCAVEAIAKAVGKETGKLRTAALDSYLRQAEWLAAKGQKDEAFTMYKQLYAPIESLPIRTAAVRGMILTAGDKTSETIVEILKSGDKPMQTVAIATLKDIATTDVIKAVAEQLPTLATEQQIQLIAMLAECGERAALPAILAAAKSAEKTVRIAALYAIGILGDTSTLEVLEQAAITTSGPEQRAAQESLYRLRGADVDRAILKKLAEAEPKARLELIRSCDRRNITAAAPELMRQAKDADELVRIESIKALRNLAGEGEMAGLVELQLAASGTERGELEKTVVAVGRRIPEDKNPAQKVLAAIPTVKDLDAKCSLLSVLGKIGDPAALPVLREGLNDKDDKIKDAAVRALSDWPTAEPAEDLLKVAKESANAVHKAIALRAYIRLAGLPGSRTAEETIKMYEEAMILAPSATEKRMVLAGLANVGSIEAMRTAAGCLADTELKQEAEAAVVKIAYSTIQKNPQEAKELLRKVLTGTTNESIREQSQKLLNQGK